jgi:hypothetical protein
MPAPVNWTGTPTSLWASFPGGIGAPGIKIPLSGGARRSRRYKSRKSLRRRRRQTRRH